LDTVRDLGRVEPWQESLERSLARRGKSPKSTPAAASPARARVRRQRLPRAPLARRSRLLAVVAGSILALALVAATLPSLFAGRSAEARVGRAQADSFRVPSVSSYARPAYAATAAGATTARTCRPVAQPRGYVNPLAVAHVTPERVDQGVDYAGSGTLTAIGPAKVTRIDASGAGWPGAFIEYRLLAGYDSGCYVYYAEGVTPAPGLRIGAVVGAGEAIASIIRGFPTGIELGWASGRSTITDAAQRGEWSPTRDADNVPTAAGRCFSALIAALGGPAGKIEG
jgi:hypothetical protein